MAIISSDYDGAASYYFSQHGSNVVLKAGVVYNYDNNWGAFVMDGGTESFLVAGLVYSSAFGIVRSGSGSVSITIAATGMVAADNSALYMAFGSTGGADIANYGVISGYSGISFGSATTTVTVKNFGTIQAQAGYADAILTGGGADTIINMGTIVGYISTGDGNDVIDTHLGRNTGTLSGGAGDDTYIIAGTEDVSDGLYGQDGGGYDTVNSYGNYTLPQYIEALTLVGSSTIGRGNASDNTIYGNDNGDRLFGGAGKDFLFAGSGDDILRGGDGDDTLQSIEGSDQYFGNAGDDIIAVGLDKVKVDGGAGLDVVAFLYNDTAITVDLSLATGKVVGGAAALDTLTSIEGVWGSQYDDTLTGDAAANNLLGYLGNDTINGGGGDDIIEGFADADTLDGGDGIDILSFANDQAGVTASLTTKVGTSGAASGDTYANFESVRGGFGNDTLTGSTAANVMEGGRGNDVIGAGAGTDTISGDAGDDTLTGGAGADLFVFGNIAPYNRVTFLSGFGHDTITDFQDKVDRVSFVDNTLVQSLSDLTISQSGANTIVTVTDTGDTITLLNFSAVKFTSADVIFGSDVILG